MSEYYKGGRVQSIITVPYRGGEGGSNIQKIALRNLWTAPKEIFSKHQKRILAIFWLG